MTDGDAMQGVVAKAVESQEKYLSLLREADDPERELEGPTRPASAEDAAKGAGAG